MTTALLILVLCILLAGLVFAHIVSRNPPHAPYDLNEAYRWAEQHYPGSRQDVAATVAGILTEQTGAHYNALRPESDLVREFTAYDEFDVSSFVCELEDAFGITIPEAHRQRIHTFNQLVDYLHDQSNPTAT